MGDKSPFQRCYERTLRRCSSAAKAAGIEISTEAKDMTTPERGLFEQLEYFEPITPERERMVRALCSDIEQRLAEAEKLLLEADKIMDDALVVADENDRLVTEIAQLRARCGELEQDSARYHWAISKAPITDFIFKFLRSNERHISNAIDAALTATPQPAQEQR